jgi:hypothetical protein
MINPYLELTRELNRGRLRALLSSGQAVVMHRLAIMSKDGDWILREDAETTAHVLTTLDQVGARYRFGAPLDVRWLAGGWSSHFEHRADKLRLRTDFVTRPPRVDAGALARMWADAEATDTEVVPVEPLAALKLTRREKDFAVVGELARLMTSPRAQLLYSRSARDLMTLAEEHPRLVDELVTRRPLLAELSAGRERLEAALDRERRVLMHQDEERLGRYEAAAENWAALWTRLEREAASLSLPEAHQLLVERAERVLPFAPPREVPS